MLYRISQNRERRSRKFQSVEILKGIGFFSVHAPVIGGSEPACPSKLDCLTRLLEANYYSAGRAR
jgi:hypothetical protein